MKLKQIFLLSSLGFLLISSHCRNANSRAREGLKYLEQGKKITALKYFEEALDANKKNPLALYGKGKIMTESTLTMSMGQKMLESSLEKLDSEYKSDAILSLAKSYARTNLYDRAIKTIEKGLEEKTTSPEMYTDLSFYFMQTLDKTKARNILYKGFEIYPSSLNLTMAISDFEIKHNNNYKAAIAVLNNYSQSHNENIDVMIKLAYLNYKSGNTPKALEILNIVKKNQSSAEEKKVTDDWISQIQSGKWQINP